jgi:hypothetical protein
MSTRGRRSHVNNDTYFDRERLGVELAPQGRLFRDQLRALLLLALQRDIRDARTMGCGEISAHGEGVGGQ